MAEQKLRFAALQSDRLVPLLNHDAVKVGFLEQLHSLHTTQAYRVLGRLLRVDSVGGSGGALSDYDGHDEIWLHATAPVASLPPPGSDCSSHLRAGFWGCIDFIVLLSVFDANGTTRTSDGVEVRVVINSGQNASKQTSEDFARFASALSRLHGGPLFFMGVDDYLFDEINVAKKYYQSSCDNYSMDAREWHGSARPIPFEQTEAALGLGLEFSQLTIEDLQVVQERNKIQYDVEYLQFCLSLSTCIRRRSDGALVAWGLAHGDFQFGCMHTVPEYRRRGLARYIVYDLGDKIVDAFTKQMREVYHSGAATGSQQPVEHRFALQLSIEDYNEQSRGLFGSIGFKPAARVSWSKCDVAA
ncbi:hypothetical protein GQ54DRAFT_330577 [Martensiomyces pterosporus]|nr:hypothetical protein GQ54DRAFT_330577 [Martensiomyces pterosporus]